MSADNPRTHNHVTRDIRQGCPGCADLEAALQAEHREPPPDSGVQARARHRAEGHPGYFGDCPSPVCLAYREPPPGVDAVIDLLNAERARAHDAGEHEYERGLEFAHNPLVAALRAIPDRPTGLDEAWAATEAALGEYWRVRSLTKVPGGWEAVATDGHSLRRGDGPTPTAALQALARLSGTESGS